MFTNDEEDGEGTIAVMETYNELLSQEDLDRGMYGVRVYHRYLSGVELKHNILLL